MNSSKRTRAGHSSHETEHSQQGRKAGPSPTLRRVNFFKEGDSDDTAAHAKHTRSHITPGRGGSELIRSPNADEQPHTEPQSRWRCGSNMTDGLVQLRPCIVTFSSAQAATQRSSSAKKSCAHACARASMSASWEVGFRPTYNTSGWDVGLGTGGREA